MRSSRITGRLPFGDCHLNGGRTVEIQTHQVKGSALDIPAEPSPGEHSIFWRAPRASPVMRSHNVRICGRITGLTAHSGSRIPEFQIAHRESSHSQIEIWPNRCRTVGP